MTETTEAHTVKTPWFKKWWIWTIIGALIIIGGISSTLKGTPEPTAEVTVSAKCADALQTFGDVDPTDLDGEAEALTATTQACPTAEEYLMAVHANPETWFYNTSKDVQDDLVLTSACINNTTQPMCVDAKAMGLIK